MSREAAAKELRKHLQRIAECVTVVEQRQIEFSAFFKARKKGDKIESIDLIKTLLFQVNEQITKLSDSALLELNFDSVSYVYSRRLDFIRDAIETDVNRFAYDPKFTHESYVGPNNLEQARECGAALMLSVSNLGSQLQALFNAVLDITTPKRKGIKQIAESFQYVFDREKIRLNKYSNEGRSTSDIQTLYGAARIEFQELREIIPRINISEAMSNRLYKIISIYKEEDVKFFDSIQAGALSVWPQLSLKGITEKIVEEDNQAKFYSAFMVQAELLQRIGAWGVFSELRVSARERKFLNENLPRLSTNLSDANKNSTELIENDVIELVSTIEDELKNFTPRYSQLELYDTDSDLSKSDIEYETLVPKRAYKIALFELIIKILTVSRRILKTSGNVFDDLRRSVKDEVIKTVARNLLQYLIISSAGLGTILTAENEWVMQAVKHTIELLKRYLGT